MTTFSATYSPDDNKLRLYASARLDRETYDRVKAAGFSWAPKQELFVAPMWTPAREDLLLELAGEIGDEDTALVDRAEDRAERFEGYSEKRAADADAARRAVDAIAEGIPLGQPILVGHHSERRARKDAERIETGMRRAIRLWETSGYWQSRAAGAIRATKYKERPDVRRRRIKGLEADQRKHERDRAEAEKFLKAWRTVGPLANDPDKMLRCALFIANHDHCSFCFPLADYPRQPPASQYEGQMSVWSALEGGVIAPTQAADLVIPAHERGIARHDRWLAHIAHRLEYERAMLAEAGGTVTDRAGPEQGGACRCWASPRGGWSYIQKVNKVSVTIRDCWSTGAPFRRLVPFDEITGIISAADVRAAREAGTLVEVKNGVGFVLTDAPPPKPAPERPRPDAEPAFDAMKAQLTAGVKVAVVRQLFPTPPEIADRMMEVAEIEPGDRVLEPSAGTGCLLDPLFSADGTDWRLGRNGQLVAIEINRDLADALRRQYVAADVRQGDFLQCDPAELGTFDVILMNPPFENAADIKHIEHARKFLRPGGRLVAICADGPRQRERLMPHAAVWKPQDGTAFKEQGTSVRTVLLVLHALAVQPVRAIVQLGLFGGAA